jgi:hypothetical protein
MIFFDELAGHEVCDRMRFGPANVERRTTSAAPHHFRREGLDR